MLTKNVLVGLLSLTAVADASVLRSYDAVMNRRATRALDSRQNRNGGGGNNNNNGQNNNNGGAITLDPQAVQTGSQQDGNPVAAEGEFASETDDSNFINFCVGQTLTNGLQNRQGSCNGIVMGQIPAANNMVSSVILNPAHNDDIDANTDFDIQVQVQNFAPGTFTNADNTYYTAPQQLDGGGNIIGHTHVTVQDMGNSLDPQQPLDATQFAFFKGINDAGNGNGLLTATVAGGLPNGNYRVCTMFAAANHQPVIMPVAQRGAQDDCQKFTVGGNGNNNGQGQNQGQNGQGQAGQNQNGQNGQNQAGQGQAGQNGQNQAGQGQAGQGQAGQAGQNGQNQAGQGQAGQGQAGQAGQNGQNQAGQGQAGQGQAGQAGQNGQGQQGQNNGQFGGGRGGFGGSRGGFGGGRGFGGAGRFGNSAQTKDLGGAAPEVNTSGNADRPFEVLGNSFVNEAAAIQRACSIQNNSCSDAVNAGGAAFTLADCQAQEAACNAAA